MSVTVDANILLYAVNDADDRHGPAQEVLTDLMLGPGVVYLFWPVAMAFLRISTLHGVFPRPLAPDDALGLIDELLSRGHIFCPGEDVLFWDTFREIAREQGVRGNLVTDAHIVALMRRHGVRTIISNDRDFRRFDDIVVRDPFA